MNLTNFYYDFNVGEFPENQDDFIITNKVLNYLIDAGISEASVIDLIIKDFDNKKHITKDDLPDKLWNNSLLKKNTFYYHQELQILSPAPTWNEVFPFYREMKIIYTEENILNYFSKTLSVKEEWINKNKEIGSIKYLLKKYAMFDFIEPIDFLLLLIDYVKSKEIKVYKLYDISNLEMEFASILEHDIKNSIEKCKNTIIWR